MKLISGLFRLPGQGQRRARYFGRAFEVGVPTARTPRHACVDFPSVVGRWLPVAGMTLILGAFAAHGATFYVNANNHTPYPPYDSWAGAAPTIQTAVDRAAAGDLILVTNGTYDTGGMFYDSLTNRVVVTKAVVIRSVNGPSVTSIVGYQMPDITNGPGAIRCVYLGGGATLSGFTLTQGGTLGMNGGFQSCGGGLYCDASRPVATNCILAGNSAYSGGGVCDGILRHCTLTGNTATDSGGGAYSSVLLDSTLSGNSASYGAGSCYGALTNCLLVSNAASDYGGGADGGTLYNCNVTSNTASYGGGGVSLSTLYNCAVTSNTAYLGGGTYAGTLNNCTVVGNLALGTGGGADSGALNNCAIIGNTAYSDGGGVFFGRLTNCTLTGNSADVGGGSGISTLNNCIVYYNTAHFDSNYLDGTFNFCCTTPLPTGGQSNITTEPLLASASHIGVNSPCRNAGSPAYTNGVDIDGEAWASRPSIGCDEFWPNSLTGPLSVAIATDYTNVTPGFSVNLQAIIAGRVSTSIWDFGDGVYVINRPYATHAWSGPGDYLVRLIAYNSDNSVGITAAVTVHVRPAVPVYVAAGTKSPQAPYATWATAATNIQDAVDAAMPGGVVLVGNGVYQTGGRLINGASNRLAVTKPLMVRSINGPAVTSIVGYQVPDSTNGPGAVRCVYLSSGAVLSGFTLTNGAQQAGGGGLYCEPGTGVATNCVLTHNSSAFNGGGAYCGTLIDCTLISNSCAFQGGGAANSILNDCLVTGNFAGAEGGGACGASLTNCAVTGNSAATSGGGTSSGLLNNCTVTGNRAFRAGGTSGGVLFNCLVYYNSAYFYSNYFASDTNLSYCCTTPLPTNCIGCFDAEPQLASSIRLSATSPCRGAGSTLFATGLDLDGEPWTNAPAVGCDEYWGASLTGPLTVAITADYTNVAVGFNVSFQAVIGGRPSASAWDFGDGTIVSNRPYVSHVWTGPGDYAVILRAWNKDVPTGQTATQWVHVVSAPTHYVALGANVPAAPYASWATAARSIQEAVDVAVPGALVLVSNGVYQSGTRNVAGTSNRVAMTKSLVVRSVNGPDVTSIVGYQMPGSTNGPAAVRCVYLAQGAMLSGFTLTNGATLDEGSSGGSGVGGGLCCEPNNGLASNCVFVGNSASSSGGGAYWGTLSHCRFTNNNSFLFGGAACASTLDRCALAGNWATYGGGAYQATLNNCVLIANTASSSGGGVDFSTLTNCTLVGNSAPNSSGSYLGSLANCIVYYNLGGTNFDQAMNYCCTTPIPAAGQGNFTNAPLFVDLAGGDLRLQRGSPCINAGCNDNAPGTSDLDDHPRIMGGTVDVGAYEFPFLVLDAFHAWLQAYGLPADGSADDLDSDHDGLSNRLEWMAGTNPTNAASVLRCLMPVRTGGGWQVTWTSVTNQTYFVERATQMAGAAGFWLIRSNLVGNPGFTSFTDSNAPASPTLYYRVGTGGVGSY